MVKNLERMTTIINFLKLSSKLIIIIMIINIVIIHFKKNSKNYL